MSSNWKDKTIMIIGCDGYIGYPLALRCVTNGAFVIGVDNGERRNNVRLMRSVSATKLSSLYEREEILNHIGDYHPYDIDSRSNKAANLISDFKPDVIVNLGHCPSAPWSMINSDVAAEVLKNNIISTNNILWTIKNHSPNTHYITIGSTGEYCHTINVDIEEGYFTFKHKGRDSKKCLFPREANSIYHASKISSTYIIDYLTRLWGLRCTDIMQSIVFGIYTDECNTWKDWTRLDSDDAFGTVINRFIVQALLGEPLTIYGHGKHQRAFLSLNDSIQALEIAINNPAKQGEVQSWNQLSDWYSIENIAKMVTDTVTDARITHIDSPRKEFTGGHYYNYSSDILKGYGYEPTRTIQDEVDYIFDNVKLDKESSTILRNVIKPQVIF